MKFLKSYNTYILTLSSTCTLGCGGEVETAIKGLVGRLRDGQAEVVKGSLPHFQSSASVVILLAGHLSV
jgi:hypothetical protein